jgi:hypothetical protein
LLRIRCSSFREEVAAVWGRWAIAIALPFIISFNISYCSFETGCYDASGPLFWAPPPGAPHDVTGLVCGFASNECISLIGFS